MYAGYSSPYFFRNHYTFLRNRFIAGGMVLLLVAFALPAGATIYYSKVTTGNFNAVGSWTKDTINNPNASPLTAADTFVIRNGHTISLNANMSVGKVIIRSGGTLSPNNTRTLTNASAVVVEAGGTFNLTTRNMNFTGDFENSGTITGSSGQVSMGGGTFTNNGTMTVTTGRVNTSSGGSVINNGSITMSSSGRIILTDGSLVNNGSITMAASSQITKTTGTITNGSTGTITITSGTATITMGTGDFINDNTGSSVNFANSNVTITGTATDQKIGGFVTNGRLSCTKASGKVTLTGNVISNGLTMNGTAGTLDLGVGLTHTTNGTVIVTAGTLYGGTNTTLNVAAVSTSAWGGALATVFDPGTGTVNFNGAGDQRISAGGGDRTFYNLSFSGSGMKYNSTAVTQVNNIFSIEEDATTNTTASQVPALGPDATLRYNTSTPRTSGLEWVSPFVATGGVVIDNTGAITPDGDKEFAGGVPLTINSGATLTPGANQFTFGGDFINNGVWTPSSGDVIITGTANQDIGSFATTGTLYMTKTNRVAILQGDMNVTNLVMNGPGGVLRLGGNHTHTITGVWTNTAGTLRCNSSTLNVDGDVSGTAITFEGNNGLVHFRGNTPQVIPDFTYNGLELSGTGLKTLSATTIVEDVLTIDPGAELDLGSQTLELAGNGTPLVNNGVFTAGTSTVLYSGTGSATIAALDYYDLDASGGDRVLSSTDTIGVAGSFIPGTGTYTVTNSRVDFNGDTSQDLPTFTFNELFLSSGPKKILGSIIVSCQSVQIRDGASLEINGTGGGKLNVIQ